MTISYRNRLLDILVFNIYHLSHSPVILSIFALLACLLSWINWTSVRDSASEHSLVVQLLTFALFEGVYCVVGVVTILLLILLLNFSKMNKTVLADCTITLDSDFITTETRFSRSQLKWDAFQKLARTNSHIFLYVMQHGAIVIPRRAFSSRETWDEFWHTCQTATKVP